MPQAIRTAMESLVRAAQDSICAALSAIDGKPFREDVWQRDGGGGGCSRVMQDGAVFEKAGVGTSIVYGTLSPEAARTMGGGTTLTDPQSLSFYATGISLVLHPHNPMAPTVHANYRYFERGGGIEPGSWWFGGGSDLTPAYLFDEDAQHFHQTLKVACDRHDAGFYPRFKSWCDQYFYIAHRGERRGIGGIFFDDLHDRPATDLLAFAADCAATVIPGYLPLVQRRKDMPFTAAQKEWQALRRGRYVEFNLVYDRGTTFGLRTAGRIESILMSLPLTARWEYCQEPAPHSAEAQLLHVVREPRAWV